jgi:hypothetical protein
VRSSVYSVLILLSVCLVGCARSGGIVNVTTTAHYKAGYQVRGTLNVVLDDPKKAGSIDHQRYLKLLEDYFEAAGYTIVKPPISAEYTASVMLLDGGWDTDRVVKPIIVPVGGGTSTFQGTASGNGGNVNYSGSVYTPPDYKVVGFYEKSVTTFSRLMTFRIATTTSLNSGNPVSVYESVSLSSGHCGTIHVFYDAMINAVFDDFPGRDAMTRKKDIKLDAKCQMPL